MNIFEGNQIILNVYSQTDSPKTFTPVIFGVFITLAIVFGLGVGLLGYLAYGNATESTILFNMPNHLPIGIAAKLCYLVTIVGSYIIMI